MIRCDGERLTRTPSNGEEEDVDADEGDHGGDGGVVMLRLATSCYTDDSSYVFAHEHADGADDHDSATAVALDDVKGGWGREDVDDVADHGC